jgi:phage gpG-like protein
MVKADVDTRSFIIEMQDLTDEMVIEVKAELSATAKNAVDYAVQSANFRTGTGTLKGSITYNPKENNADSYDIGAPVNYAPYVEFGTGTGFVQPADQDITALAALFKGAGIREVNLPARPYLIPAVFKAWDEYLERIEKIKLS